MAIVVVLFSFSLSELNLKFTLKELLLDENVVVFLIEYFEHFFGLGFGVHSQDFSFLGVFVLAEDSVFADDFFALDCSPDFVLDLFFLF